MTPPQRAWRCPCCGTYDGPVSLDQCDTCWDDFGKHVRVEHGTFTIDPVQPPRDERVDTGPWRRWEEPA